MRSSGRDWNKFSRPLRAVPNRSCVDLGTVSITVDVVDRVSWTPPRAFRKMGANFNHSTDGGALIERFVATLGEINVALEQSLGHFV
jgi:hypothetical protein